jgi:hypothetical protein
MVYPDPSIKQSKPEAGPRYRGLCWPRVLTSASLPARGPTGLYSLIGGSGFNFKSANRSETGRFLVTGPLVRRILLRCS